MKHFIAIVFMALSVSAGAVQVGECRIGIESRLRSNEIAKIAHHLQYIDTTVRGLHWSNVDIDVEQINTALHGIAAATHNRACRENALVGLSVNPTARQAFDFLAMYAVMVSNEVFMETFEQ